jgi:NAD(P)-dependent dehydrogenase (short-subunit alcohol dehydrogenase family)
LRKQKDSSIVILSSYTAYDLPAILGHYAITKTALVALTKLLAKSLIND